MAGSTRGPLTGTVNMMPLIDILFQIVIFFLIAAQIQVQERSLPIVLPQASAAMPLVSKPKEFFVQVDREGRCYAGGQYVDLPTLEKGLNQAATDNPLHTSVVIRADKKCEWEHVVAVMNICNKVGIGDYRVTTAEPGT
jgi:biopolymer transport protein ExbD